MTIFQGAREIALVRQAVKMINQILKAGGFYFALVFAAGFVLGGIRTLWITPRVGERKAELMETPIMFAVIIFAARRVAERFLLPGSMVTRLGVGFVALCILLTTELTVVLWLRRLTIREYVARRDPVAGTVYLIMLAVFALLPLFVVR